MFVKWGTSFSNADNDMEIFESVKACQTSSSSTSVSVDVSACQLSNLSDVTIDSVFSCNIRATLLLLASSTHSLVAFRTSSCMSHSDCLALLWVRVTYCLPLAFFLCLLLHIDLHSGHLARVYSSSTPLDHSFLPFHTAVVEHLGSQYYLNPSNYFETI